MARVVTKQKQKDPAWLEELTKLAQAAMWLSYGSAEAVQLRNMLKRNKGFGNISKFKIETGSNDYDEMGFLYGANDRILGVTFWKYKKEWKFP